MPRQAARLVYQLVIFIVFFLYLLACVIMATMPGHGRRQNIFAIRQRWRTQCTI